MKNVRVAIKKFMLILKHFSAVCGIIFRLFVELKNKTCPEFAIFCKKRRVPILQVFKCKTKRRNFSQTPWNSFQTMVKYNTLKIHTQASLKRSACLLYMEMLGRCLVYACFQSMDKIFFMRETIYKASLFKC